jgi:hypothetical protein
MYVNFFLNDRSRWFVYFRNLKYSYRPYLSGNYRLKTFQNEIKGEVPVRAMKVYGGSRGISPHFLASVVYRGEWSVAHPGRVALGEDPSVAV